MPQQTIPARVLVVDDDDMSRELLVALLEVAGYVVTSAESGQAALALLESSPSPNIILTDMQMPGCNPLQLAGRLRRACGRATLLVAMSGSYPPAPVLSRYDAFLLKPFTVAEFTSAIVATHAPSSAKGSAVRQLAQPARHSQTKTSLVLDLAASAVPASKRSMDPAPHSTRSDAAPILDEFVYRQLAASVPSPQLHQMYSMCLTDARARIADMRTLAAAHDSAQISRQAHAIKGSAGMLGATEMHRIAALLETDGTAADSVNSPAVAVNSPAVAVNSLDELSAACDRLERMLGSRA